MKNLLTISKEGLKKEKFLLEAKGLLQNKAIFKLEEVLATTKTRKITKVLINPYNVS